VTDPSLIADLIRAGVDPDLVARVSNAIASNYVVIRENPADNPRTSADEKRRAYDRERQRIRRMSADNPRTSAESAKTPLTIEDLNKKERKRTGERISADWKPSDADFSFARSKGMPQTRVDLEAEKFRNYWVAKTGTAATKLDWPATWRNWVLSSLERMPGEQPSTVVQLKQTEHGEPTATGFYLMDGTPERDAWDQFDREAGRIPRPRDRRGGWNFPTKWPEEMQKSEGRNGVT